jgi:cbb3-type cytochrome oxidase maturation protein
MELVFVALPVALLVGGAALAAFVWAAKSDQFEDLDTPPTRVLFDEPTAECGESDGGGGQRGSAVTCEDSRRPAADALDRC